MARLGERGRRSSEGNADDQRVGEWFGNVVENGVDELRYCKGWRKQGVSRGWLDTPVSQGGSGVGLIGPADMFLGVQGVGRIITDGVLTLGRDTIGDLLRTRRNTVGRLGEKMIGIVRTQRDHAPRATSPPTKPSMSSISSAKACTLDIYRYSVLLWNGLWPGLT